MALRISWTRGEPHGGAVKVARRFACVGCPNMTIITLRLSFEPSSRHRASRESQTPASVGADTPPGGPPNSLESSSCKERASDISAVISKEERAK